MPTYGSLGAAVGLLVYLNLTAAIGTRRRRTKRGDAPFGRKQDRRCLNRGVLYEG